MNTPDILSRPLNFGLSNLNTGPDSIIIEIGKELNEFYTRSADALDNEYSIDQTVDEVIRYISDLATADVGINAIGADILLYHTEGAGYQDGGHCLAEASMDLGKSFFKLFCDLGFYNQQGYFPFEFQSWVDNNTMLLRRQHE